MELSVTLKTSTKEVNSNKKAVVVKSTLTIDTTKLTSDKKDALVTLLKAEHTDVRETFNNLTEINNTESLINELPLITPNEPVITESYDNKVDSTNFTLVSNSDSKVEIYVNDSLVLNLDKLDSYTFPVELTDDITVYSSSGETITLYNKSEIKDYKVKVVAKDSKEDLSLYKFEDVNNTANYIYNKEEGSIVFTLLANQVQAIQNGFYKTDKKPLSTLLIDHLPLEKSVKVKVKVDGKVLGTVDYKEGADLINLPFPKYLAAYTASSYDLTLIKTVPQEVKIEIEYDSPIPFFDYVPNNKVGQSIDFPEFNKLVTVLK